MALLLATAKRIVEGDMFVRVGKWFNGDFPLGVSLAGKTIGIVGLGGIGSKVAKRCEAFEMNVVYYGPREKKEYSYPYYSDITKLAQDCDMIILTCPGGEATANLIDANVLEALGPKGILINIARGSVVDEPALVAALQNGVIAAAGLDVFSSEPNINELFAPIAKAIESVIFYAHPFMIGGEEIQIKLILVWLVAVSVFLTVYLGFINIRYFKHGIDLVRGKYDKKSDKGEINRFQALTTSLSGTVGLGNIAGVAVAVSTGGPGAVFWMAVMGLFGMSAKFAEAALGVKYRVHPDKKNRPDHVVGGPMYYLKAAFERYDQALFGKFLGGFFAVCCVGGALGAGNMFQANQAFQQVVNVTGGEAGFMADKGWIFGVFLALLVGVVIIGGLKSIAAVASRIVPFMGGVYLLAGFIVIAMNYQNVPAGFVTIFDMAFTPEAGFGALIGALLIGVQRAAFSNEAGIGSAAIVHSTAKVKDPVSQGFVGMLGPFIDTIVICMVTALVIVMTGAYEQADGMEGGKSL
ncbi:unnamed protein product [Cyprideis torosa]|uniref:Uncharacterized protein n=1 Tax=Cyprideis torosa TaxID=163714 RepID=A0A7R8WKX7_9CRUS|nr:unnamed protein product [Cyprideis torosa]CAG0903696.1 unnamed protein product [Cyprideis torosa]